MSYEIRADYTKRWLFPPALEDWVKRDHPARFVREFVDSLDLVEAGFTQRESPDGRPNYAADLLLKVFLYGYMHRNRTLRGLERACHDSLGMVWLTGLEAPDHNTLWRFLGDNRKPLKKLFRLLLRAAVGADLVGMVLHAVDGTKVLARASKKTVWNAEDVQKVLADLDAAVEEILEQTEASARSDGPAYELPPGWAQQMLRREQLRELAQQMEAEDRRNIPEEEREARFMKTRQHGQALAYNAQIAVDQSSGLIVAQDVLTEGTDNHALVPMLDQVQENLGSVAEQTVSDAGYYSGKQLEAAEAKQYPVLVHESAENKAAADSPFHSARFGYNAQKDCVICPLGKELGFQRHCSGPTGEPLRQYRCGQFRECPERWQCSKDPQGRTVRLGKHHEAIRRQREKRGRPEMRALLRRRKEIVEYPFGLIKRVMEFCRFTVAGHEAVRTQWAVVCTAFNLRRLYREWTAGKLVFARA